MIVRATYHMGITHAVGSYIFFKRVFTNYNNNSVKRQRHNIKTYTAHWRSYWSVSIARPLSNKDQTELLKFFSNFKI